MGIKIHNFINLNSKKFSVKFFAVFNNSSFNQSGMLSGWTMLLLN